MSRLVNQTPKSRMAGVGMLEILIALLVVAIGVLGLAQLQGVATRQNNNAYLRSQATILAYSVADRMRANQANAPSYVITMGTGEPSNPPTCTDGSRRDQDLCAWLNALTTLLPSGDGSIAQNANNFTITVQYDDNRDPLDGFVNVVVETEVDM